MDKKREWAVVSDSKKEIYAHNCTERQAYKLIDKLEKLGVCADAKILYNGDSRLSEDRCKESRYDYINYIN